MHTYMQAEEDDEEVFLKKSLLGRLFGKRAMVMRGLTPAGRAKLKKKTHMQAVKGGMDPYEQVCMYACMCVCMYVCMYVCRPLRVVWIRMNRYVSMHVCMHICMYVCMLACRPLREVWIRMNRYVCMYACMYVCMYAYMYVCMQAVKGGMDPYEQVCIYACMYACMVACMQAVKGGMDPCEQIHIYIHVNAFRIMHTYTHTYMHI
jgi:hypothetical protein